ncbi:TetR/AcrR family transcriptional regulator [Gordonibacter sp.]|uniref:TetR/AcrR family transcriptional regulator n=1 Tax=Gordonibacter sp. TaxID=1968902 RepID=UPI002FCBA0C8
MARPRKNEESPVEERLEKAFWSLVETLPLERITVGALAERAGCNRSTFYYYYRDVYDLLDRIIEANMPQEIPALMFSHIVGGADSADFDVVVPQAQPKIDNLCVLLNSGASTYATKRIKDTVIELWKKVFGLDAASCDEARLVFEFVVNGLLGVMAYRAETGMAVSIAEAVHALTPEIPEAVAAKLRACREAEDAQVGEAVHSA